MPTNNQFNKKNACSSVYSTIALFLIIIKTVAIINIGFTLYHCRRFAQLQVQLLNQRHSNLA